MSYKIESNGSMPKHLFTPLYSKWNNPSLIIGSKCAGIKYKSLILWKQLNVQREVIGPDYAISGTEPSSVEVWISLLYYILVYYVVNNTFYRYVK